MDGNGNITQMITENVANIKQIIHAIAFEDISAGYFFKV